MISYLSFFFLYRSEIQAFEEYTTDLGSHTSSRMPFAKIGLT